MFKHCDDAMYGCYDKLAIFCCFTHYLKIREKSQLNETSELVRMLVKLANKSTKMVDLNKVGRLVDELLDLVLEHDVTMEMVDHYSAKTFPLGKRSADTQTEV